MGEIDGRWALNRSVRFNPQRIRKTRPSIVLPKMIIFGKRPCRRRLEPGASSAGSGVDMTTQEPPRGGKIESPAVTRSHTLLDTTKPSIEHTSKRLQNSKRWKAAWYFILSNSMLRSRLTRGAPTARKMRRRGRKCATDARSRIGSNTRMHAEYGRGSRFDGFEGEEWVHRLVACISCKWSKEFYVLFIGQDLGIHIVFVSGMQFCLSSGCPDFALQSRSLLGPTRWKLPTERG